MRSHPSADQVADQNKKEDQIPSEKVIFEEVKKGILDFVYKLIPNADLIREFNGNFIFLIPLSKRFAPSKIYQ